MEEKEIVKFDWNNPNHLVRCLIGNALIGKIRDVHDFNTACYHSTMTLTYIQSLLKNFNGLTKDELLEFNERVIEELNSYRDMINEEHNSKAKDW
jgi:hypothetical protein